MSTTVVKERPILFSAPMVRAILEGRKTQTRRILQPQPVKPSVGESEGYPGSWYEHGRIEEEPSQAWSCPYGVPGDRIWVKETWRVGAWRADGRMAIDYMATPGVATPWLHPNADAFERLFMQSTHDCEKGGLPLNGGSYHWLPGESPCRLRPSIFMPRWASRITLEITKVRVQRLQEIGEEDAEAEGITHSEALVGLISNPFSAAFACLWDSINAKRGFAWESNPWVWAITFSRLDGREWKEFPRCIKFTPPEPLSDYDIQMIHAGSMVPSPKAILSMSREIRKWRGDPNPDAI